ncbi:MAG TPA: aspartate kinase [Balneolaceae bacterium]|nr:aspartate kinase [Balneolaceae bacterium]
MLPVHVLKFGGTSLKNASFIRQAVHIIAERKKNAQPVVVVSAIAGVTDRLVELASTAKTNADKALEIVEKLRQFHIDLFNELAPETDIKNNDLDTLFDELKTLVRNSAERDKAYEAWRDHILSFGERASVRLIETALHADNLPAKKQETQHLIKTDNSFGEANVLADETRKNIRRIVNYTEAIPVITGFIGSTEDGTITTLGRSGSDYTASLVADALDADHLEIWTDVNGVLTADPDVVPSAQTIDELNFEDVAELATHGAGVIHSKTIQPIRNRDISLRVRNSHDLNHPGTHIHHEMPSNGNFRSVTVQGPFVYLRLDGEYANALRLLIEENINAHTDSDAFSYWRASQHEPTRFLVCHSLFESLKSTIEEWTAKENIELDIKTDVYKVKKFANELRQDDSSVAYMLRALREKGIQPITINRNYDQRHITLLLPEDEASEAARTINNYWIDGRQTMPLFIAGTGAVGGTLIEQLKNLNHRKFNVEILGRCDSTTLEWKDEKQPTEWPVILQKLNDHPSSNIIFVDATGSEEVARLYPQLFEAGIHVVTPSKLANTFEQSFYNRLRKLARSNDVEFRYETTVGAGLPIISTIKDLQDAGDVISEISGVVSGTMTYLFNQLEEGIPFSKAIADAREKGYAEPDPRDDLSGEDVARKFLTLARETGRQIERQELQVQSLIPDELASVGAETFMEKLPAFDDEWKRRLVKAHEKNATLRYVGRMNDDKIWVGIEEISVQSPIGQLRGTDNLVRISSRNYNITPLIIQGPGAGKRVTASGILADILKVMTTVS